MFPQPFPQIISDAGIEMRAAAEKDIDTPPFAVPTAHAWLRITTMQNVIKNRTVIRFRGEATIRSGQAAAPLIAACSPLLYSVGTVVTLPASSRSSIIRPLVSSLMMTS